jgi:hypothetical protein
MNRKAAEDFCVLIKETTQELGIQESPDQLFNMDEN